MMICLLLCITVPVGRSRSVKNVADTKLLLRWRWQKQVPTFFKAHLHSNAQKGSQKSGSPELKPADKNLLKKIKKTLAFVRMVC